MGPVPIVTLASLTAAVLPKPEFHHQEVDIDAVVQFVEEELVRNHMIDPINLCWRSFPNDPKDTDGHEGLVFQPFISIWKAIIDTVEAKYNVESLVEHNQRPSIPQASEIPVATCPDGVMKLK